MGALGAEGGGPASTGAGRGASTDSCEATLGAGVAGGTDTALGAASCMSRLSCGAVQ